MTGSASDLARRLGEHAEEVCREYLSNGHRCGNYWMVGDVRNTRGRSMHVRLKAVGGKAAGKWVDESSGEYGDLLDVIKQSCGLVDFREVADEARRFLSMPLPPPQPQPLGPQRQPAAARGSPDAARRLFALSQPIAGTLAERYLADRGILLSTHERALRFHPGCYYRDLVTGETQVLPALIAAVTSLDGQVTGLQRTWLDPSGQGKAQFTDPRRSLGDLLGNGIWLGHQPGAPVPVMAAGEGFETMASLRTVMPAMPAAAATSANHLAGLILPPGCRRLYIAADADAAGRHGIERLSQRAGQVGILALVLRPQLGDFNDDLRHLGPAHLAAWLSDQLVREDVPLFLPPG
ncbi:DNA primase [Mesorhizobium huakuii]|uniref:Toprim domain-containing protein n=1 Tax=Mesorhizobium qingshengii TaxID=1165689 RepID=A0A1G5ZUF5_9HYPH|nr:MULTISPECIES: toprim domain-containing protein [Mesorhizobium]AID34363.1 DNA primase [Mesorhizobium huakuii 7653R]MCH4560542.1 toprim domain-containing protein [Mesorhizobium jarvisii]GLQ80865.1 DNA primase [Mesorhizobium huakuii]SDA98429.1 Toprim domain-containing protein [Mesorhizobium qingshengii]